MCTHWRSGYLPDWLFIRVRRSDMRYPYPRINCTARVPRIYIWVRWSRGQPIRGQLHWGFDQSEASEYAGADGCVMTGVLSDGEENFPMKWEPENYDPISVTELPRPWDGKQIAVTTLCGSLHQIGRLCRQAGWVSMWIFSVINSPN